MNEIWKSSEPELLPDFIIGGAMKSGTTTLHNILNAHPRIFIPDGEVHFFDMDNVSQHSDFNFYRKKRWITQNIEKDPNRVWNWYRDKFRGTEHLIRGEDSTTYLSSRIAAERIAGQEKEIKLIFLLRQPSERAFSNYLHLLRSGKATYSFEDTLLYCPGQILTRSLYLEQLQEYFRWIPKERIKIVLFEDFVQRRDESLSEICQFLGVEFAQLPAESTSDHSNQGKAPRSLWLNYKKNQLIREFGNNQYRSNLPFTDTHLGLKKSNMVRMLNKAHSILNPQTFTGCEMNRGTKVFLDDYFRAQMDGLDKLLEMDVTSKWFSVDESTL